MRRKVKLVRRPDRGHELPVFGQRPSCNLVIVNYFKLALRLQFSVGVVVHIFRGAETSALEPAHFGQK